MTSFTVLGGAGFIGSHLLGALRARGVPCSAPGRDEDLSGRDLGHVVYCVGLTADFRQRPLDTVDAHVAALLDVLRTTRFESLLYLSSTRLYAGTPAPAREDAPLTARPLDPSDLYNLSKAMGESLGLHSGRPFRVARLSNVYGQDSSSENFLASIVRDALRTGRVQLRTSAASEKDYVSIRDVVAVLPEIALRGRERIYNVASGVNVSNGSLCARLRELTGCAVEFAPDAPTVSYPTIDVARITTEFAFRPAGVLADLESLVRSHDRDAKAAADHD